MKKITTLLVLFITVNLLAQIPAGYYDSATGTGYALKTQLYQIINSTNDGLATEYTANSYSYNSLYTAYQTTDTDTMYENDGTVLDMYSENPSGNDPYNYNHSGSDTCGNYSSEGDCYNREHLMPQSVFNSASPMKSDVHFVVPSDGKVNGQRSNHPFGEVSNPTWTSLNGSKLGSNTYGNYSGTVFEPIDEFKGDIARMLFYFATRYENQVASWNHDMLNGTSDQVYADWFLAMLISWHNADPVSQREIDRNNACFAYQNNRNPFIDHPEWVATIWSGSMDTTAPSVPTNLVASNPTSSTIDLSWTAATDNTAVTSYDIYRDGVQTYNTTNTTFTANGLQGTTNYCFTVYARDAANNVSNASNQSCETTLAGSGGTGICAVETFENIPADNGSYNNRTWSGDNGLTWSATNARTDRSINNRAITIKNGILTAPTTTGGIGELTVTTKREFSGSAGSYDLKVNGVLKGTIPYGSTAQTTTITAINIENNVSITLSKTASSSSNDRVAFDDLSWTCYSAAAGVETNSLANINVYPNPIKDGYFTIRLNEKSILTFYTILGEVVQTKTVTAGLQTVTVNKLTTGFYLLKIQNSKGMAVRKIKID